MTTKETKEAPREGGTEMTKHTSGPWVADFRCEHCGEVATLQLSIEPMPSMDGLIRDYVCPDCQSGNLVQ